MMMMSDAATEATEATTTTTAKDECSSAAAAGADNSEDSAEQPSSKRLRGPPLQFKVSYQKNVYELEMGAADTVLDIKTEIQRLTGIPPTLQKMIFKGLLKDSQTLEEAKITQNSKVMLMASQAQDILSVAVPSVATTVAAAGNGTDTTVSVLDATEHQKIISRGPPADVEPRGEPGTRMEIPERGIVGLLNSRSTKTRISLIIGTGELQIATPERTQRVSFAAIKSIISEPIKGHDGYHAVAFQIGPTAKSQYWVYWMPSHYVENIKDAILGPYRSLFGF